VIFLDENKIKEDYDRFMSLIEEDPRSENLKRMYGDLDQELAEAPAAAVQHHHNAFPGGYLDHVLRVYDISVEMTKTFHAFEGELNFTSQELQFATLHHDLGKLGEPGEPYYVEQDSDWHRKTLGQNYKYNNTIQYMSVTDRAHYMLQQYDIKITKNEWLGIHLSDGMYDESNKSYLKNNMYPYPMKTNIPYIVHVSDYLAMVIEKDKGKF
jgi:hypothetical protein